ncbi:MAG TPA: response regulator, partial [Gemmataceae bacterium]|nr:response regulator [Gemmataceae bacterium]
VVDDNATNRLILQEMLASWHMRPVLADGAAAALELLETAWRAGNPFALILIDGQMPGVDGFALAEQIRRRPELAGATVMMLTSGGEPGDVARCRRLGVARYLLKPVKQSDLFDAIITALGAAERREEPGAPKSEERPAARALRVLLAEDNAINQELVLRVLGRRGHTVSVVGNGREAVEALTQGEFDVVLMDVQMPEMGGFEATRLIRQAEEKTGRRVPILALTAHAMKGDREKCLEAGMDGYVAKPVRAQELIAAVEGAAAPPAPASPAAGEEEGAPAAEGIDWSVALERVAGDRGLLCDLLEVFLQESPAWRDGLRRAAAGGEAAEVQRLAHTFKSSLRQFGAAAAGDTAARLEALARAKDTAAFPEALAELERAVDGVLPAFRAYANSVVP